MCVFWRVWRPFRKRYILPVENRSKTARIEVMYEKITRNIRVHVAPQFLAGQSKPEENKFIWAYTISIENRSSDTVTLLTRHWVITDANGTKQEVRGDGVVGETPTLEPGQRFQYTSGCPLSTPSGIMAGSYGMTTKYGEMFEIAIPAFSLDSPHDRHSVN
jgi:ApaG protein